MGCSIGNVIQELSRKEEEKVGLLVLGFIQTGWLTRWFRAFRVVKEDAQHERRKRR